MSYTIELEYLLDRGVRDSDVFSVHGDFDFLDYKTVANHLRILYNVLSSPEIIAQIRDSSYNFLERSAASTLKETAQCITTKNAIGGLVGVIGEAIKELGGLKKPPIRPFGDCGFSLN